MAAIELRKAGHSYNHIAASVGVSKGTLAVWLADIPYTPNLETIERIGKARAASGEVKSRLKRESFRRAREEASADIKAISHRDLFMLGLGLYIGEGAKSTSQTCFVNSNPAIVNLLIKWFIKAVGLKKENLRIRLHTYPDCNEEKSLQFWSETTTIPESQFLKTIVDWRKDKKAFKSGKLPHGTAHLSVNSLGEKRFGVFLARKIMAWSDEVLGTKNAGVV
ncbi:MAG: hypothetical protein AAB665_03030 [Patescibacteria group bacterium]